MEIENYVVDQLVGHGSTQRCPVPLLMMGVLAVAGRWSLNGTQRDLINTGFNFISPHHTHPRVKDMYKRKAKQMAPM